MKQIATLVSFVKENYLRAFIISVVFLLIANVFELLGIGLLFTLLGYIQGSGQETASKYTAFLIQFLKNSGITPSLPSILLSIILMFCLKYAFIVYYTKYIDKLALRYQYDLTKQLFGNYLRCRWETILQSKSAIYINAVTGEVRQAMQIIFRLSSIMAMIIGFLGYSLVAVYLSWKAILLMLIFVLVVFYPLRLMIRKTKIFVQKVVALRGQVQNYIQESVLGAKYIKAVDAIDYFEKSFNEKNLERTKKEHIANFLQMLVGGLQEPLTVIVLALMVFVSLTYLHLEFASILALAFLVNRLYAKYLTILTEVNKLQNCVASHELCYDLIRTTYQDREQSGTTKFTGLREGIELKDIDFSYHPRTPLFKGLSLKIKKGMTVGFVGRSGSGKTTAADLIIGLLRPHQGDVFVDGIPLSEIEFSSYRKKIAFVPQDSFLINDTVYANICLDVGECSMEKVKEVARMAYIDEFIEALPDQYQTVVGDRGVRMSGGQKQRIALARAFMRGAEIFIFDEATSALDTQSERFIQEAMKKLRGEKTVIVIAHRIQTILDADRVYLFKDGVVSEVSDPNCLK